MRRLFSLFFLFIAISICLKVTPTSNYCSANLTVPNYPQSLDRSKYTLMAVKLITRHGDRVPYEPLPKYEMIWNCAPDVLLGTNDLSTSENNVYRKIWMPTGDFGLRGTCDIGVLTEVGFYQHVKLGRNLRQKYVDILKFLPPTYDARQYQIRSTFMERTLQSAEGNSAGFYPFDPASTCSQVRNISTTNFNYDPLTLPVSSCPNSLPLAAKIFGSPEAKALMEKYADSISATKSIFGEDLSLESILSIGNNLLSRYCHNYDYPPGVTQYLVDELYDFGNGIVEISWNDLQYIQMMGSPILHVIFDDWTNNAPNITPKFQMYSAHDTTVGMFLASIGSFDNISPSYASHVEIELYKNNSSPTEILIAISYNGKYLKLFNGQDSCPLSNYIDYLVQKNYLITPQQREELCYGPFDNNAGESVFNHKLLNILKTH